MRSLVCQLLLLVALLVALLAAHGDAQQPAPGLLGGLFAGGTLVKGVLDLKLGDSSNISASLITG